LLWRGGLRDGGGGVVFFFLGEGSEIGSGEWEDARVERSWTVEFREEGRGFFGERKMEGVEFRKESGGWRGGF